MKWVWSTMRGISKRVVVDGASLQGAIGDAHAYESINNGFL